MSTADPGLARTYVEHLLRTGLVLTDLLSNLLEDAPEQWEGEPFEDVLIDMLVGTAAPAVQAAGADAVSDACALMEAVVDRVISDLRTVAQGGGRV